jgi:hypothetical protein
MPMFSVQEPLNPFLRANTDPLSLHCESFLGHPLGPDLDCSEKTPEVESSTLSMNLRLDSCSGILLTGCLVFGFELVLPSFTR